jgi:hypothetical protein
MKLGIGLFQAFASPLVNAGRRGSHLYWAGSDRT